MSEATATGLVARSRCGIHGDLTGTTGRCPRCDEARGLRRAEAFVRSVARAIAAHESMGRQHRRVAAERDGWPGFDDDLDRLDAALDLPIREQRRARVLVLADEIGARADVIER